MTDVWSEKVKFNCKTIMELKDFILGSNEKK